MFARQSYPIESPRQIYQRAVATAPELRDYFGYSILGDSPCVATSMRKQFQELRQRG